MCKVVARALSPILGLFGANDDAKKAQEAQQRANDQATTTARETAASNQASAEKVALENRTAAEKVANDNRASSTKIAAESAAAADTAMNRANGKTADTSGIQARTAMDAKGGVSGTMLTGPQGVDPKSLLLGKTTLLGG